MKKFSWMLLVVVTACFAARGEALQGEGTAMFSVRATGHTVEGSVVLEPFTADLNHGEGGDTLSMVIEAKTIQMTTDHKKRDKEMMHHLHAEDHPVIRGQASSLNLEQLRKAGETDVVFPLSFSMVGFTVENEARVTSFSETEEGMSMTVAFDVSQEEHFLILIRKFGFLKVDDTVHVEVELALLR